MSITFGHRIFVADHNEVVQFHIIIMGNKITTISGVPPHAAKKICKYAFGSHYHSLELNQTKARFEVMLIKEVDGAELDESIVKDFADYWGVKQWKFYYINKE